MFILFITIYFYSIQIIIIFFYLTIDNILIKIIAIIMFIFMNLAFIEDIIYLNFIIYLKMIIYFHFVNYVLNYHYFN